MLILVSIEYIKWMHEVDLSTRSDQRNRSRIAATICNCDAISRVARKSKSNHWFFSDWCCHRCQMLQLKFGQFSLEEDLAALETFPPFFSFSDPKRITIHSFQTFSERPAFIFAFVWKCRAGASPNFSSSGRVWALRNLSLFQVRAYSTVKVYF